MKLIGLTGSIATGKSTVASMLTAAGLPVFDADAEVHRLYAEKSVIEKLRAKFPDAVVSGRVDRQKLGEIVFASKDKLKKLEAVIHTLVEIRRQEFLEACRAENCPLAILDIPLLFETGRDREVDFMVLVTASEIVQKHRVMQRPGMTEQKLAGILARQISEQEKRKRADLIIENSGTLKELLQQVHALVGKLNEFAKNGT